MAASITLGVLLIRDNGASVVIYQSATGLSPETELGTKYA